MGLVGWQVRRRIGVRWRLESGLCENPGRKSVGAAALAWDTPAGPSIVVVATVLFAVGLAVGAPFTESVVLVLKLGRSKSVSESVGTI